MAHGVYAIRCIILWVRCRVVSMYKDDFAMNYTGGDGLIADRSGLHRKTAYRCAPKVLLRKSVVVLLTFRLLL